ncbi:MAG: beta-N-acetylglucosaminidase domain-containing protein [Bdellovibrionia bacterium]
MNNKPIGVIEGFFGPVWSNQARMSYADLLKNFDNSFYIYAPKRDARLRRQWKEDWSSADLQEFTNLHRLFSEKDSTFGVGLSPLGFKNNSEDQRLLLKKIEQLNQCNVRLLGLFFDDMPVTDNLAQDQLAALSLIQKSFSGKIIFCPSFYSFDPILEKVFGKIPTNYFADLAAGIPPAVEILWTGPKVISQQITKQDMDAAAKLFGRKLFLWDNLFANDGPKRCKLLPLHAYKGRDSDLLSSISGVGLNMMNQGFISQLAFLSSRQTLTSSQDSEIVFDEILQKNVSKELKHFIHDNGAAFMEKGLDNLSAETKELWIQKLGLMSDSAAAEIEQWLRGEYIVGPECLTE